VASERFEAKEFAQDDGRRSQTSWLRTFFQDLRFGIRMLSRVPFLTGIIIITLALGIGANTAIFSVVNGFLLRPLPVVSPEQIAVLTVSQKDAPIGSSGFSYPEFVDFRSQAATFSDIFAIVLSEVQLTVNGRSEQCVANYVSGSFFSTLGIKPSLGRLILPNEGETRGEPLVVVLGYSYWNKRFRGDPGIVGKQVLINNRAATVLGVVEPRFHGMYSIFEMDAYLPISGLTVEEGDLLWTSRDLRRLLVYGRLRPGVSLSQAQSSLDVVAARLAGQYPASDKGISIRAISERSSRPIPYANKAFVAIAGLFMVLAIFVLLLACINVESILLARGAVRGREMGIRSALGASRGRLIRQMLTESVLLGLLGGSAGILLGVWAGRLMGLIHPSGLPLRLGFAFDWRVFTYAMTSVLVAATLVGLLPALRASSTDVNSLLHEGGQSTSATLDNRGSRSFLVIAQVAASLVLLTVAGLFARSLQQVQKFDLGFNPENVLNVTLDPGESGYDHDQTVALYREIVAESKNLPGVRSVSVASNVPMGNFPGKALVTIEGRTLAPGQAPPAVQFNSVDSSYFKTMEVTLLRGRELSETDTATSPMVAVVNQTMAKQFWGTEDAVGKRFSVDGAQGPYIEVVGVMKDGKYQTVSEDPQAYFCLPIDQHFVSLRIIQLRTIVPPESVAAPVEAEIRRFAPDLPILQLETMKQSLEGAFGFFAFRLSATLAGILGGIGLILAVVGVYGVVSFAANQRTREIGIRMALGATPRDILNVVWRSGIRLVVIGVGVGILLTWAVTREMLHTLVGISTNDPMTYVSVAALLTVVGLAACWIPARRAMRTDPISALRHE
jgi:predicted permease